MQGADRRLILRTFGGVELRAGGQRVQSVLTQPKRLALLLFLACDRPGSFQPREHLMGLFWPDSSPDRARASLRQSLSFLRSALGEGVIVTSGKTEVGVDPELLWCDAERFQQALDSGDLPQALELYQGEFARALFVAGSTSFERWLDQQRDSTKRLAGDAAWRLAGAEESQENRIAAAHWARESVRLLPLDEGKAREAIRMLHRIGDVAGALDEYRRLERRLELELECAPAAATRDLIEEIRGDVEVGGETTEDSKLVAPAEVPDTFLSEIEELDAAIGADIRVERMLRETPLGFEYLATDRPLRRLIRVKVLSRELAESAEARSRFDRESLATARIRHANVPELYRVGRTASGLPFALRPFIRGTTLEDRLRGIGVLPAREVRSIMAPIAGALAAAHANGIVHRDVRPANVIVEESSGRVFLMDFGLARILESGDEEIVRLTRTGLVLGDPEYVSPEQLHGDPVTDRSDVFSLGVLIRRLLVGPEPQGEALDAIRAGAASLKPDGDAELGKIVRHCLHPRPGARPPARDVAKWLAGPAEGEQVPEHIEAGWLRRWLRGWWRVPRLRS